MAKLTKILFCITTISIFTFALLEIINRFNINTLDSIIKSPLPFDILTPMNNMEINSIPLIYTTTNPIEVSGIYLFTSTYKRFNKNYLLIKLKQDNNIITSLKVPTKYFLDNDNSLIKFNEKITLLPNIKYSLEIKQLDSNPFNTIALWRNNSNTINFKFYQNKNLLNNDKYQKITENKTGIFAQPKTWQIIIPTFIFTIYIVSTLIVLFFLLE